MPLVSPDRVKETSNTTGLDAYTLLGPELNFRSFEESMSIGDECYYGAVDRAGAGWETGKGKRLGNNKLARIAIVSSSNGGAPVSWSVGVRDVFSTLSPVQLNNRLNSDPLLANLTGNELLTGSLGGQDVTISLAALTAYIASIVGAGITPPGPDVLLPFLGWLMENGDAELNEDGFFSLSEG